MLSKQEICILNMEIQCLAEEEAASILVLH